MSEAAHRWRHERYQPATQRLAAAARPANADVAELYCQVLEHKWFLSERAQPRRRASSAPLEEYVRARRGRGAERVNANFGRRAAC